MQVALQTVTYETELLLLLLVITAILAAKYFTTHNISQTPPGPWGLPFIGYYPFLNRENLHIQLENMKRIYGDVFSFRITGRLFIHLGTVDAIKEAHVSKSDCFQQRYTEFNVLNYVFGDGLVCRNGEAWRELRKFFNRSFKEWGISTIKYPASETIDNILTKTVNELKRSSRTAVDVEALLRTRCSDIMHTIFFRDEKISDGEILSVCNAYKDVMELSCGPSQLLIGNFARYIIFPFLPTYRKGTKGHEYLLSTWRKVILKHENTRDETHDRNFIDSFLRERNERKKKGDITASYFTVDTLAYTLIQLTGDGVLDVANFIGYFVKALLDHPDEQEKVYEEIVAVVGTDRQPTLEDKLKLPYTNAFVSEVTRISDFFPLFPSLECTKDTSIRGYRIPKGSITLMNMWSAQHDSATFEEPHTFNPSRYLPTVGKPKEESPIIFGKGKRTCTGETFTMNLVFLFVITLVYNFKLSHSTGSNFGEKAFNVVFSFREV